ncbi:MAG: IS4 family transposase [Planctomycetota bacterium]
MAAQILCLLPPEELLDHVLTAFGKRDRFGGKLPFKLTAQLTVTMALSPEESVESVLEALVALVGVPTFWRGKPPQASSITAARDRLSWEVSRELFRSHAKQVQSPGDPRWKGFRVVAADGTTFRAPDTAANEAAFGKPNGSKQGTFPVLRCLAIADVNTHKIVAATLAPYAGAGNGEVSLLKGLVGELDQDVLTLMDRGFCGFDLLRTFVQADRKFVVRMPKGGCTIKLVRTKVLQPDGDYLVTYPVPKSFKPKKGAKPLSSLREIRYTFPKKRCKRSKTKAKRKRQRTTNVKPQGSGKRRRTPRHLFLLTNLVDPKEFPADQIAELYLKRWEIEFVFREIKSTLTRRKVHFRSKKPRRVLQEVYATLTAYNLIRDRISAVARELKQEPTRLGYAKSLQRLKRAHWGREPWSQVVPSFSGYQITRRPPRSYPRAVRPGGARYPAKKHRNAA